MAKYRLGYKRSIPHIEDKKYKLSGNVVIPETVDLTSAFPPAYDQEDQGSCVDNTVAGIDQFLQVKENLPYRFMPSRDFLYFNARSLEGTELSDSGSTIRDCLTGLKTYGVCPESGNLLTSWPYSKATMFVKPPVTCYVAAVDHIALEFESIDQDEESLKTVLAEGYPFAIGIAVYSSFMSDDVAKTGIVPLPGKGDQNEGGHCVSIVGYDKEYWYFRNSWASSWALNGYGRLPISYLLNSDLAFEFQKLTSIK